MSALETGNPEFPAVETLQGDTGDNVANDNESGFHFRVTLGDLITILVLGSGIITFATRANTKIDATAAAVARVEARQERTDGKMDNWYERLVVLEQQNRDHRPND